MLVILTSRIKSGLLATLVCFLAFNVAHTLPAYAGNEPAQELIKQEFSHQLPSMWRLEELTLSDVIYQQNARPAIWKAKLMATIVTKEDTYLPTEYGLGNTTVVRPVHKAGVKRKLFGRVAARKGASKGWEVAFWFDNDVTLSAGLPLDYFFGEVVIEGSQEYKALDADRLTSHIDASIKEHHAALLALQKRHDAQVMALKRELKSLDDINALESTVNEKLDKLQEAIAKLQHRLNETKARQHGQGILIRQWVSSVVDPYKDLPNDRESNIKRRDWERSKTQLLLGKADNTMGCGNSHRISQAWSPYHASRRFKGTESIQVEFTEAVIPTELAIFEAGNHGFVRRVTFFGEKASESKSIDVNDTTSECPGTATIQVVNVTFPARRVTIEIDANHENKGERYFAEGIDAVQLTGFIRTPGQ